MTSADQPETTTLSAKCHCKSVHITITLPTAALPLKTHLCHCYICRRVHGTLCCFHAPLPAGTVPILSPASACTRYVHSDLAASARLFCSTCGCHIGDEDLEPPPDSSAGGVPEWRIATSLFPSHFFTLGSHIYPPATRPSLASWIPDIPSWTPEKDDPMFPIPPLTPDAWDLEEGRHLRAGCMCGGVTFAVQRPSKFGLLFRGRAARFNAAVDRDKWVAHLEFSDDVRLTTGASVMAWVAMPVPAGFLGGLGEGTGMIKVYQTRDYSGEEGRKIVFCGGCGATCFSISTPTKYDGEEESGVLRVAMGVWRVFVDGREDPLLGGWIEWEREALGVDEGRDYDSGFLERLMVGFEEWLDESGCGVNRKPID